MSILNILNILRRFDKINTYRTWGDETLKYDFGWLVFYAISNLLCYLMPIPLHVYILA